MRILDALEIPSITDLDEFITRLDTTDQARIERDLRQFVVAKNVEPQLESMLQAVGERFAQGVSTGRFIFGSFGTGKSHLMSVLGRMFEGDERVYDLGDPALGRLRAKNPWIDDGKTLVVRLNMMDKKSVLSALAQAFNAALPEGSEPVQLTDEARIFALIESDAERMGMDLDAYLQRAVDQKAINSVAFYHRERAASRDRRMSLAAKLLNWRETGEKVFRPQDLWVDQVEAFGRMAEHATGLGYTRIVWLIDELIIWIRSKARAEYIEQLNMLSALVDHDSLNTRTLPFLVLVAVQQDIKHTCPDDLSEEDFHKHIGHIGNRFEPRLELEQQDLYEICIRRVLQPREAEAEGFRAAIDKAFDKHHESISALAGDTDLAVARQLYPFHPALLRVLVDVTQVLSRSRTAMAVLYKLLHERRALEVGKFIPVGDLFGVVLDSGNVNSVRDQRNKMAQRFTAAYDTYQQLAGKIDAAAQAFGANAPAELHQLVRTVLLCQLSQHPHFRDGRPLSERVTASTLFRLNQTDVRALKERTGITKVTKMFRHLGADPRVQLRGDAQDPIIEIKTENNMNLEGVLSEARAKVQHPDRFRYCRKLLNDALGLGLSDLNQGRRTVRWRGTKRAGLVHLANVRTLSYAGSQNQFEAPDDAFLILVDYPFDEEPGKGQQDDIATVHQARKRRRAWTVAWLPAHFSETERRALTNSTAVELIRANPQTYLTNEYTPRQAEQIMRALESYQSNQEATIKEAIQRVYFKEGLIHGLGEGLDEISIAGKDAGKVADHLARTILSARYPRHPMFTRDVRSKDLQQVADHVVRVSLTGQPLDLKVRDIELVKAIAEPMELVYVSETSISKRPDGPILRALHDWIGDRTEFQADEMHTFLAGEGKNGFGFTDDLYRFFAWYLLQAEGYEARRRGGSSLTVDALTGILSGLTFVKAKVVDAATWEAARTLARRLLGVRGRRDVPSAPEQAKLQRDTLTAIKRRKQAVKGLIKEFEEVCGWADVLPTDSARGQRYTALRDVLTELGGIDEPHDLAIALARHGQTGELQALMPLAPPRDPEKGTDVIVDETRAAGQINPQRVAFATVAKRGTAEEKAAVVDSLRDLLKAGLNRPLAVHVEAWATLASQTARDILDRDAVPPPPKVTAAPPPLPPPPPPEEVQARAAKDLARAAVATEAKALVDDALAALTGDRFDVEIVVRVRDPKAGA